jgi:hypothetical protein
MPAAAYAPNRDRSCVVNLLSTRKGLKAPVELVRESATSATERGTTLGDARNVKISVERVSNGFIVRDESTDEVAVVAEQTEVTATQVMLTEVIWRIGPATSGWEAENLRVIVLPGRKWMPARRGGCAHPWIERSQIRDEPQHWWCPCGAEFTQLTEGGSFEADSDEPRDPPAAKRSPAEEAEWKARGWAADKLGTVYAVNGGRYVVSLILTYNDSPPADVAAGLEEIHSPEGAAAAALELTRDAGSRGTIWHVFDRLTGQMHPIAQRDFDPQLGD